MEKGFDFTQALAEADRCLLCHDPPCSKGCPAETDPGTFIRKLRMRNITGAIRTIKQNNALGGACGVLCPTPRLCEKECSATGIGRPIQIGKIQRFLIEQGWRIGFKAYEKSEPRPHKVAVVGSGPAGLSCAAELARRGVQVTVFEQRAEPGGVIRYGVPAYRFDKAFLKNELQDLKDLGVKFKCNARVEGAEAARKLLDSGYQAVFLAPGLWGAERLPAKARAKGVDTRGVYTRGVYTSVDFLAALREERFEELARQVKGKAVAVIGGGSVAMDCAESAFKLGARDVYLVYRRSYAQMPAEEDERQTAQSLGVHFLLLNQPTGYLTDGSGRVKGLRLVRTRLGEPDVSGRRRPVEVKGSAWTLEVSVVVEAIGNRPDPADWSGLVKVDGRGLVAAGASKRTSARRVYAGGDLVRGPALVVEAVQDGKLAARAILDSLK
jgi:NADPH-dependent glutamate synthase beta subunit-like oxidoreductase